jgi:hypothetical protein
LKAKPFLNVLKESKTNLHISIKAYLRIPILFTPIAKKNLIFFAIGVNKMAEKNASCHIFDPTQMRKRPFSSYSPNVKRVKAIYPIENNLE